MALPKFAYFRGWFLAIFRGPKVILEMRIFPPCLGISKDRFVQKFFAVFLQ
jgi:hypothetical protein